MILVNQRKPTPYNSQKKLFGAKGVFPDLAPSPEAADHPFKRKDVGIKANLWREVYITLPQWCRHSLPVCRHSLPVVSTQPACVSTQSASGVDTVCLCVDTHCPSQKPVLKQ
ncbi:hypothetical protein Taro_021943 [Colocasia esculenta]|uniref:Uncharacterized protein n=1 Tax=Colocasia esculenta TaxID=4460 RepID=A0A843V6H1_COLES|nr:hypothetical protein [Colocasia esculenta]